MPWFGHLLDVGRLVVAEEGGAVVGFAGLLDHGSCVALSDLFVRPTASRTGWARRCSTRSCPLAGPA